MITLTDPARRGRREFLRIGTCTLGGISLAERLAAKSYAFDTSLVTDRAVILLFLHGGPSQFETFDPKMSAPSEIRSATGEVATKLPGVTFGGTFPRIAAQADKLTIVRSYVPGDANHDIKPVVGRESGGSTLGSLYSRVAGTNHPSSGIPTNVVLLPQSVDPTTRPGTTSFGRFDATGAIGSAYAPFVPGAGGDLQRDMQLAITPDRLGHRRELLQSIDQLKRSLDVADRDGIDRLRDQAFRTILGGVADAFDLSKEDARTVARYDTAPLLRPDSIDRRWNNYNNYLDNVKSLGKLLVLARRLCERGCGFVTVTTNFVWDMHADVNNAGVEEGMRYMGSPLDHAVSAFIEDVEARGLQNRILLVCCGEIGRTPRINKAGGRDHWGNLAPLLLYGGGIARGAVIGQSSRDGGVPQSEPVTIKHLVASVMRTVLNTAEVRTQRGLPRDIVQISEWDPIPGATA